MKVWLIKIRGEVRQYFFLHITVLIYTCIKALDPKNKKFTSVIASTAKVGSLKRRGTEGVRVQVVAESSRHLVQCGAYLVPL